MKYVCQTWTQRILDHMYPVPEHFKVDPQYLCNLDENEFIDGFHCLWNTVRDMYKDIVENPEAWGLPCNEKDVPGNSSHRLMDYLYILFGAGELRKNVLIVTFNSYNENLKKDKPKVWKVSNAATYTLISRLSDFGFAFSGFNGKAFDKNIEQFIVSYEDNKNLIPALKGYCKMANSGDDFRACQYHLIAAPGSIPEQARAYAFSQYITGEQKDFFIKFNERMTEEEFTGEHGIRHKHSFDLYYFKNVGKSHIVCCKADNNQLRIELVITAIPNYCGYIENQPERIKTVYKGAAVKRGCYDDGTCGPCTAVKRWIMDGEEITTCGFGKWPYISDFNLEDIDTYISIIKLEAKNKQRYG